MTTHRFKKGRTFSGCAECGSIAGNEAAHGHTCNGKMILNAAGGATCYECGRSTEVGSPIFVGDLARARTRPWFHSRQIGEK